MRRTVLALGLAAGLALACPAAGQPARPFTIDVLLRHEAVGNVRVSPDGRWIAVEQQAPYDAAPTYRLATDTDRLLSSVRLVEAATGRTVWTLSASDRGFTAGRFSPDGRRMAVYELTPDSWRLGLLTLETGEVLWTDLAPEDARLGLTLAWRNAEELLVVAQGDGRLPEISRIGFQAQARIAAHWAATASGRAVGGSFIRSGTRRQMRDQPPPLTLALVDVRTGAARALARGAIFDMALSPDGRHVAVLEDGEDLQPSPDRPVLVGDAIRRRRLRLIEIETGREIRLQRALDYAPYLMAWSGDGRSLLAFARDPGAGPFESDGRYVRLGLQGEVTVYEAPALQAALERSPWDEPIALGGWRGGTPVLRTRAGPSGARWASPDGGIDLPAEPGDRLVRWNGELRVERGERLLSLTGGPPLAGRVEDLGDGGDAAFRAEYVREATPGRVLANGDCVQPAGRSRPVCRALPAEERRLVWGPDGRFFLSREDHRDGRSALRLHGPGGVHTLAEVNEDRADLAWGELLEVPHTGPAGEALTSWLLLPPGLPPGARAPLVVEVYPGRVLRRAPAQLGRGSTSLQNNPAVLAGGGFAVLMVSLPNPPQGRWAGAELAAALEGVADAAAATGRVEGERFALLGHSYGAYNVLNAAAHSRRVAAVVASNGYADLVRAFELPPFYRSAPEEGVPIGQLAGWVETGQAAIGPFPETRERYVAQSPLYSAETLTAPALLIESDLERPRFGALFGVLYRLGREAALLTYYGEGHTIASPANLRDLHARILDWLAAYLGPPAGDAALPATGPGLEHGGEQRLVGALPPEEPGRIEIDLQLRPVHHPLGDQPALQQIGRQRRDAVAHDPAVEATEVALVPPLRDGGRQPEGEGRAGEPPVARP